MGQGEKERWLTAWVPWLPANCTRVGLCFHFLGLGVRSLWPPGHSRASISMSCSVLILLLEGMFSLLRSAVAEVALQSPGKGWESERPASSHCACCTVFISSTLEEVLFGGQAMRSSLALLFLYLSLAVNELFTAGANSIYCLLSTLLIDIFFAVFRLIRPSNPYVTDLWSFTKSPSTRISRFHQRLQLLWLCHVSADKVTAPARNLALFTVTKTPTGSHSTAMRQWGQVWRRKLIKLSFCLRWGGARFLITH